MDFLGRLHHLHPAHLGISALQCDHCHDEDDHHCGYDDLDDCDDDHHDHWDDDDENDDQYYQNHDQLSISWQAGPCPLDYVCDHEEHCQSNHGSPMSAFNQSHHDEGEKVHLWFVEEGVIGGPHLRLLDHWSPLLGDHLIGWTLQ